MLFAIRRDGSDPVPLSKSDQAALGLWWTGNTEPHNESAVQGVIGELHQKRLWLSCSCLSTGIANAVLPILVPARQGNTLYLRRLVTRANHAIDCPYRYDQQTVSAHRRIADTASNRPLTSPSFLVSVLRPEKVSVRGGVKAPSLAISRPVSHTTLADRLLWLAEQSGWQHSPNFKLPIKDLLEFSKAVPVGPLSLKDMLFCDARGWTEAWFKSSFAKCRSHAMQPTCWWVQLATRYDTPYRTVSYFNGHRGPLELKIDGPMEIFGGETGVALYPMVVISLVSEINGTPFIHSTYAHPVLSVSRWMLVNSDLERKTYDDLADVCFELGSKNGIAIDIDKPLNMKSPSMRLTGFVLTHERRDGVKNTLSVETVHINDPISAIQKKQAINSFASECIFDHRKNFSRSRNSDLQAAVRSWAMRVASPRK